MRMNEPLLCEPCAIARDDPLFRVPTHLVHPVTRERMLFDVRCTAVCRDCGTRWRRLPNEPIAIVAS